jgi:hypothetical protein
MAKLIRRAHVAVTSAGTTMVAKSPGEAGHFVPKHARGRGIVAGSPNTKMVACTAFGFVCWSLASHDARSVATDRVKRAASGAMTEDRRDRFPGRGGKAPRRSGSPVPPTGYAATRRLNAAMKRGVNNSWPKWRRMTQRAGQDIV